MTNGFTSGHVRVYGLGGDGTVTNWEQHGQDIDGEARSDQSGFSVSLSADGNTLAVGAPLNDENGNNSGHERGYHKEEDDKGAS